MGPLLVYLKSNLEENSK